MTDITDLIAHLEDERRLITAFLEERTTEEMDRTYFYHQGKLVELNYIIKLLRGMLK